MGPATRSHTPRLARSRASGDPRNLPFSRQAPLWLNHAPILTGPVGGGDRTACCSPALGSYQIKDGLLRSGARLSSPLQACGLPEMIGCQVSAPAI